jgi:hypothetical protein
MGITSETLPIIAQAGGHREPYNCGLKALQKKIRWQVVTVSLQTSIALTETAISVTIRIDAFHMIRCNIVQLRLAAKLDMYRNAAIVVKKTTYVAHPP